MPLKLDKAFYLSMQRIKDPNYNHNERIGEKMTVDLHRWLYVYAIPTIYIILCFFESLKQFSYHFTTFLVVGIPIGCLC